MGISEKKMQIVINNYFKQECDVNTSIREAFEKGFRIGVKKGQSAQPMRKRGKWIKIHWKAFRCEECKKISEYESNYCPHCGAEMEGGEDE